MLLHSNKFLIIILKNKKKKKIMKINVFKNKFSIIWAISLTNFYISNIYIIINNDNIVSIWST